jgi:hypothetical protein
MPETAFLGRNATSPILLSSSRASSGSIILGLRLNSNCASNYLELRSEPLDVVRMIASEEIEGSRSQPEIESGFAIAVGCQMLR